MHTHVEPVCFLKTSTKAHSSHPFRIFLEIAAMFSDDSG